MPRDGSPTLSDVRGPTLSIVCEPCGRRGRYNVEKLMAEHGDAKLTDLLVTLASITDRPIRRSIQSRHTSAVVVDENGCGNMHRIGEREALLNGALLQGGLDLRGDIEKRP